MLQEAISGSLALVGYYVAMMLVLFGLRALFRLSGELFRKMLHLGVAASVFVFLHAFQTWWLAAAAALAFGAAVYLIIGLAERFPVIMRALEERKPGEIRVSLSLLFLMLSSLLALAWGWLGAEAKFLVAVAIMAWGFGDATAALVGKRWGRRHFSWPLVDPKKTVEGTAGMVAVATVAVFVTLLVYTAWPWYLALLVAALVALVAAGTELVSHHGIDTVTVPYASFAAAALLRALLSAVWAL